MASRSLLSVGATCSAAFCSEGTLRFGCALTTVPSTLLLHERNVCRENSNENTSSAKSGEFYMLAEQMLSFL